MIRMLRKDRIVVEIGKISRAVAVIVVIGAHEDIGRLEVGEGRVVGDLRRRDGRLSERRRHLRPLAAVDRGAGAARLRDRLRLRRPLVRRRRAHRVPVLVRARRIEIVTLALVLVDHEILDGLLVARRLGRRDAVEEAEPDAAAVVVAAMLEQRDLVRAECRHRYRFDAVRRGQAS